MAVFFKPADGWAGDFIPFHGNDVFHLFYLKDYRDPAGHGQGTPWLHLSTSDLTTFADHGEALARGAVGDQDLYVFTGCVLERDGLYHIYYTGHNPRLREQGRPEQAVMHATSTDLVHWIKDPANPILFADGDRYEMHDWRDPFVFWHEAAGEYWMLLAARVLDGPESRRGCIALVTSPDLTTWEIRDPLYTPGHYFTHECPDLFRIGDWWYLVYSEFSEYVTRYRMSRSLAGPWIAPADDTLDGRGFYAAKTASDGARRFAFGWAPSRAESRDDGAWQWAGNLVIHELAQERDGTLSVRLPAEVGRQFSLPRTITVEPRMGAWEVGDNLVATRSVDAFAWCDLGALPDPCYLETILSFAPGTRALGLILRADPQLGAYYQIRLEPARNRIVFDRWPRLGGNPFIIERPVNLTAGQPISLRVVMDGSIVVIYINDQVVLTSRGYDLQQGGWGMFISDGIGDFQHTRLLVHDGGD